MLSIVMLSRLNDTATRLAGSIEGQVGKDVDLVVLADARAAACRSEQTQQTLARLAEKWRIVLHDPRQHWGRHRNSVLKFIPQGNWVVMLDDDELVSENFVSAVSDIVDWAPPNLDAFYLPRVNTIGETASPPTVDWTKPDGLAYPDLQGRLFLNNGEIRYAGSVHESLVGFEAIFPLFSPALTLLHHKTQEMQAASNLLWASIPPDGSSFFSQCDEDRFIDFILRGAPDSMERTIVELGAGHPLELSNSRFLINQGWDALLVEANPSLVTELRNEYGDSPHVEVLAALVGGRVEEVAFHISHEHWALSGIAGVSQPERHDVSSVSIETMTTSLASHLIRDWLDGRDLGVLAIDLGGSDTVVAEEILSVGLRPHLLLIEALDEEDRVRQTSLLEAYGFKLIRHLGLTDAWADTLNPRTSVIEQLAQEWSLESE